MPNIVYKLKFKIYAAHTNFAGQTLKEHYHTFQLTLYLKVEAEEYDAVKELAVTEKQIDGWLELFRNKDLRKAELFAGKDTSVETLGNTFYQELKKYIGLHTDKLILIRLDISENPIRTFSVSETPLDQGVNEVPYYPHYAQFVRLPEEGATVEASSAQHSAEVIFAEADVFQDAGDLQEAGAVQDTGDVLEVSPHEAAAFNDKVKQEVVPGGSVISSTKPNKWVKILKLSAAAAFLLAAAVAAVFIVKISGVYPKGSDVMYHMYRSSSLIESIRSGDWYPLYDRLLYNGVQAMRYWAPIPVYVLAFASMIAKDLLSGYLLYTGFVFFLGGCGWLLFGWKHNRFFLAAAVGTLWFFIPDNLRVYFGSGNLPRGLVAALLPYLLFFVLEFIENGKLKNIIAVIALISVMALCHLGETSIIIICLILFFFIYAVIHRNVSGPLWVLPGIGISFLLIGIWLYPSMQGGLLSMGGGSLQEMKSSFADGWKTLNPFERYHDIGALYFGLALFVICILGILLANKKVKPGFITGLVIYVGTTLSAYPVISNMPFGRLFWMERFVSFAMAGIFVSIFFWKELKKWIVVMLCLLIALDCVPSLGYVYAPKEQRISDPKQAQAELAQDIGMDKLKEQTKQRTAVMDLSSYGSFAPYYLAGEEPYTANAFGAAWQSAKTARNIVQLNTAFSSGYYDYMFDRCLDLGNDTVLVRISLLKNRSDDVDDVVNAARRLGYRLTAQDNEKLMFSRDINGNFGLKTTYSAIAIGDSARDIALRYPVFKETTDPDLNHYTYDELKNYKVIYLSGFTYDDDEQAETMLANLGKNGVRIYIDMNRVPVDQTTKLNQFMGVKAQDVSFEESFPTLTYGGKEYTSYTFGNPLGEKQSKWNTVYLTGLKNELGYSIFENKKIAFFGTGNYENVYFIGFNLPYHVLTRFDKGLAAMVDDMLGLQEGALPARTLEPLQVRYSEDSIIIRSNSDGVNTTLAYHDIFRSKQKIYEDNNLLVVDRGTTKIDFVYPYFKAGISMTASGFALLALYLVLLRRRNQSIEKKEATDETN